MKLFFFLSVINYYVIMRKVTNTQDTLWQSTIIFKLTCINRQIYTSVNKYKFRKMSVEHQIPFLCVVYAMFKNKK